ncbi:MAG: Rne/Rng family ribonuclease [Acidobacteriaceae bacterium]
MAKEICISSTPHETRLAIIEDDQLAEIYYERENEYTLAGSIYKGRVTRVLPGMQSAFVDIGLERDAFLYVTDFLEEQEDSADFERVLAERPRARQRALSTRPEEPLEPVVEAAPSEEGGDQEEERGARRWRGRRGRRRGGRLRTGVERGEGSTDTEAAGSEPETIHLSYDGLEAEESEQSDFAPTRSAAPTHAAVAARAAAPVHSAVPEPFVLPGESLSKYGGAPRGEGADATVESAPKPQVTVRPSTLVEEVAATKWDGGFVLPGETLSRHRGRREEQAPEAAAEAEPMEVAAPLAEAAAPAEEVAEVVEEPVKAVPEAAAPAAEVEAAPEVEAEQEVEASPELVGALEEEVVHEEEEFEPEEGSASYRVDPAAPSEFRVSTPGPDESATEEEVEESTTEPEAAQEAVTEEEEPLVAAEIPEPEETTEQSEEPAAEAADEEHLEAKPTDIFGYASGLGIFEEEEIDEDEYDFEHLHVAGMDEHEGDEMEEETLDQGSQLGEFVRERHIDWRLSEGDNGEEGEEETADAGTEESEEEDFDEEAHDVEDHESEHVEEEEGAVTADAASPRRRGRRDGRDGREDRRGRRDDRRGRRDGRHGGRRPSAQTMDLPAINELLKQGQEILVQIAKEPIAKKGARITSHIALPGRFLVFMPTVNHVGVSRKIASDEERQRLKRILISEKGEATGGFIVRTAAEHASEEELRADIRFLINLWTEIKERSDNAKAPALIYHDLNLVERILRDQVSEQFATIWVDSETDYERIVRFLSRVQPSLVRRVKLYTKETPLFEQFGIQEEISKALKSKVWLKSGGSIVINQTEALVAIDINTGKYVGKTARLEDTILRTNLDAIPEIVRQIRLRDLGGIIVIDFIDMDERKNRHRVMQALEEELKNDRAPSKVLQFNDFGLVAITRKRVKQSLERTLSIPCPVCTGTGMVKSPVTVANEIFVEMRKMQKHFDRGDVLLRVNPEVVKTLKASGGRWLNEMEEMIGKTIMIKSDPTLHPEQFDIH